MVIATAATSAVLSSATDSESFTNKALKVLFVIGGAILLAGTGVVILLLLDVLDVIGGVFDAGSNFLSSLNPFKSITKNPLLGLVLTGPTYLLNAAFGRR